MKLFCFPYAGGSSAVFSQWKSFFDSDIEIRAIELAGRGKRINEPLYKDFNEVIDDVFSIIDDEIKDNEYAFFGHSMGAKISYELALEIKNRGLHNPEHIFFSGRGAPYETGDEDKKYHLMSDEEFKEEVLRLGGTPKEFFEYPELLEVLLPMLKNDFKLAYREIDNKKVIPLDFDITVFLGKEEMISSNQIDSWKNYTKGVCTIHYFNGDHFFINEKSQEMIRIMEREIRGELKMHF